MRRLSLDADVNVGMARGTVLSFVGITWQSIVRFLTNAVIGRIGGPPVLGAVATILSTAQILALLWPTSSGSAAARYIATARAGDAGDVPSIARHLGRRTLQATCLIGAFAGALWVWAGPGRPVDAIVVCAMFAGYSGYAFTRGLQFGTGQMTRATTWDLLAGGIGLAGVVAALLVGIRGAPVLLPLAASYLLYAGANWPRSEGPIADGQLSRALDAYVAMGVVGTLASTGFLQSAILVARGSAGEAGAGMYAAALTLATPGAVVASSLSLVLFPSLASALGSGNVGLFRAQTDRATRLLVFSMVGLFGVLILVGDVMIRLVWGRDYRDAIYVLPILLTAVCVSTVCTACVSAVTTRSVAGMATSMIFSLLGVACGVLTWAVAVPRLHLAGVGIGYLVGTTVMCSLSIALVWRRDEHRWSWLFARACAGLSLAWAGLMAERALDSQLYEVAIIVLLFVVLWLSVLQRDGRRLVMETWQSVRARSR